MPLMQFLRGSCCTLCYAGWLYPESQDPEENKKAAVTEVVSVTAALLFEQTVC